VIIVDEPVVETEVIKMWIVKCKDGGRTVICPYCGRADSYPYDGCSSCGKKVAMPIEVCPPVKKSWW
jgi:hypothetical protein